MRGKTVLITGASAGIGRELAVQLANRGANLSLAARSAEALAETGRQCEAAGAAVLTVPCDVCQKEDCRNLIDKTIERFGQLDVLVNNAGISMFGRFDEITDLDVFARVMEVNYLGAVYCTSFALPHLKRQRGLIVAVSSLQGKTGFPGSTGYAASKHAMQGFFDSLRIELARSGTDVLVVSPGPVATDIHTRRLGTDGAMSSARRGGNSASMPVDECARQIVRAIAGRRRELVMTTAGKAGQWVKLIAPGLLDRMIADAVKRFYSDK